MSRIALNRISAAALAFSAITLTAAWPASAQSYEPTIEDWEGVNAAINAYQLGIERGIEAYKDRAYWEDAVEIIEPTPGQIIRRPARGSMPGPGTAPPPGGMPAGAGPGGPPPGGMPGGPPPGGMPDGPPPGGMPGGPPPGDAPPGGAPPGLPQPLPGARNMIGTGDAPWHLLISSSFEFQSETRATHYGYFLSIYPNLESRKSEVGLPGHYEDILEKRNGEWRILERRSVIGQK